MYISSTVFGDFEIEDDRVVFFEKGIPGLEPIKEYVFVSFKEYEPISWMISVDGNYHFPVAIINLIDRDDMDATSQEYFLPKIENMCEENNNLVPYVIIKLDDDKDSVSLKAPIMVDVSTKKGQQIIFEHAEVD